MLDWLAARPEQVLLLTETSAGPGTAYLLERFREAGHTVIKTPDEGERGAAIVSCVKVLEESSAKLDGVTVPGRTAVCLLDCEPRVFAVAVYVPSRDRSQSKTTPQAAIHHLLPDGPGVLAAGVGGQCPHRR